MAITLGTLVLPDMAWSDEFAYSPIVQKADYAIDGTLILQEAAMKKGRPITLGTAWVPRSTVIALQTMAATPSATFPLTLTDGRTFTVAFRRPQPSSGALSASVSGDLPFKAEPTDETLVPPMDDDDYALTLNLCEVASS